MNLEIKGKVIRNMIAVSCLAAGGAVSLVGLVVFAIAYRYDIGPLVWIVPSATGAIWLIAAALRIKLSDSLSAVITIAEIVFLVGCFFGSTGWAMFMCIVSVLLFVLSYIDSIILFVKTEDPS